MSAAIRLEVGRGGQVYYVSNRVKTIDDAVARVHEAAPEARVGVAHGKMSPREVEDVMIEFATKRSMCSSPRPSWRAASTTQRPTR